MRTENPSTLHGLVIGNILGVVVVQLITVSESKWTDNEKDDHDGEQRLPESEASQVVPELVILELGPRLLRPEETGAEHPGEDGHQTDTGNPGNGKAHAEQTKGPNGGEVKEHEATKGNRQAQGTDKNPVAQVVNHLGGGFLTLYAIVD